MVCNFYNFQDIADAAYLKSRGRPTPINLSVLVADLLFSLLLQAFFLIQVPSGVEMFSVLSCQMLMCCIRSFTDNMVAMHRVSGNLWL